MRVTSVGHFINNIIDFISSASNGEITEIIVNKNKSLQLREIINEKWTKKENDMCYWYVCSHCGHDVPENRYHNDWFSDWCPNCGARMYMENELDV